MRLGPGRAAAAEPRRGEDEAEQRARRDDDPDRLQDRNSRAGEERERCDRRQVGEQQRGEGVGVGFAAFPKVVEEERVVRADRDRQQQADEMEDAERRAGERERGEDG